MTRTFKVPTDAGPDASGVCLRGIPHVTLPGQGSTCVGDFAARTFRFALCSCMDLELGAGFGTDSFDDTMGPYSATSPTSSGGGGPVGINGRVSITAGAEVQGTLISAGTGSSSIGDSEIIHGDLKTNGDLIVGKSVFVVRNAWIRGGITAPDGVTIAGNLVQPPNAVPLAGVVKVDGKQLTSDFTVPQPCACSAGEIVAAITEAQGSNDNVLAALSPGDLTDPQPPGPIHLPCGRFYVDQVSGSAPVEVDVDGHAVLFVGADFTAWDGLTFKLAPGGELDVFVGGNFTLGSATTWGDPARAASLRYYVAGTSVSMSNAGMFAGNLYAPLATVAAQNIEVFGSLVAGGLRSTDAVTIHFDRAVLDAGVGCSVDPTPRVCATCSDCQGTDGCVSGRCGGCQSDSDCCDPLVCLNNRCEALVF